MSKAAQSRIDRLLADAAGLLDPASLWLVATCVPEDKGRASFEPETSFQIQDWLRQEAGTWPAPLKVGDHLRYPLHDDRLVFAPSSNGGSLPADHVELHPDGCSLIAVQVGALKQSDAGDGSIWTIGEGSVAWLTVCFVRFAAAWAARTHAQGSATVELRLHFSAAEKDQAMLQLWNVASGTNAPSSDARPMTRPSLQSFELAMGQSGEAALVARSLLLPLLVQFGQNNSRHIEPQGTIISANFVGHAQQIAAWARAIDASFI